MIRTLRQTAPDVPILIASGLPPDPVPLDGISLQYFIPKPFTTSQLLNMLQRALGEGHHS